MYIVSKKNSKYNKNVNVKNFKSFKNLKVLKWYKKQFKTMNCIKKS